MCINYNGVVASKNNVIIYGNFGTYLVSNDNCRTWERFSLGSYDEIMFIENFNDTLWGVLKNGYVIVSTDEGYSWGKNKIEIDSDDIPILIIPTNENIYVRGRYAVYRFDRNLRLINKIRESLDTLLSITEFDYYDPTWPYQYQKYSYDRDYFVFDKYIINTTMKVKGPNSGFIAIDKDLNSWKIVNACHQVPEHFGDTNYCFLSKIYFYKTEPVFCMRYYSLLKTNKGFTQWNYFFKDSIFWNMEKDTSKRERITNMIDISALYSNNNNLFGIYRIREMRNNKYIWDGFYLKKYIDTPKDTFVAIGNFYKDELNIDPLDRATNSVVHSGITGGVLGVLLSTYGKDIEVFQDSIHVFVNNHNFIFQTTNNGKDWKLISYLAGKPMAILNDTTYFFSGAEYSDMVIKTFDGGKTYIPSKRHFVGDSLVKDLPIKSPFVFYIDSTGQGFLTGCPKDYDTRWATSFTDDLWDSYDTAQTGIIYYTTNPKETVTSNVCKIGSKYLLVRNDMSRRWFKFFFYAVLIGDHNERKFDSPRMRFDSLCAILHIVPDNVGSFLAFCLANDTNINYKDYFEIRYTNDTGRTWTILHHLDDFGEVNQIYEHNRDSIFITFKQPDQLYLYDRTRDTLQLLWAPENDEQRNPMLMVISDHFCLVGRELFLENTNRNDLTQWREGKWDYGKPSFESVIFKGNVAIAGLSDSLRPFNYYKITLKKGTPSSVEDNRVDVRYYATHFYATQPYPLPASNFVKSKLYWDGSFDLHQAIEGVYDAMGNKIEGKARITITELGKSTAEMVWDCTGVASGIYFIVVRHNGRADTIPVIVE